MCQNATSCMLGARGASLAKHLAKVILLMHRVCRRMTDGCPIDCTSEKSKFPHYKNQSGGSFVLTGVREPKLSTPLGHTRGGPDTRLARLVAIVHRLQLQLVHVTDPQIGRRPSSAHAARPGRGRTRIQLFTLLPQLSAEVSLVSVGLQVVETWLNETH